MTFTRGDPVKLTDRFASVLVRRMKNKIDWHKRRGVFSSGNEDLVLIRWDGCKSCEQLPIKAIERAAA